MPTLNRLAVHRFPDAIMQLIQLLLPVADNQGVPFPRETFLAVRDELTGRFGGLTAFTQAPAEGLWRDEDDRVAYDAIVIFEVMAEELDRGYWSAYRRYLEATFRQDRIIIRAAPTELL